MYRSWRWLLGFLFLYNMFLAQNTLCLKCLCWNEGRHNSPLLVLGYLLLSLTSNAQKGSFSWSHYLELFSFLPTMLEMSFENRTSRDLQDGGGVRRGDHLPPHKYIRNTSTCGTTPTEYLLNAGRRPQTSQKARKSPRTWVGQKKKERQKNREGTCPSGRELWRRKTFHTIGSPFTGGDGGVAGGKLQSHGGERSNRGAEGEAERFPHRGSVPTSTHQPESLSAHPLGRAGAGTWGSGFGGQIPGRGLRLAAWTQPEGG